MYSSSMQSTSIDSNRRSWQKKSHLVDSSGAEYIVYTHDISHSGMSLFADKQYQSGQLCKVNVPVFVGATLRHFRFDCRVVFSSLCGLQGFRTKLEFLNLPPENKTLIQSVMAR
jgi:hypothetical protein